MDILGFFIQAMLCIFGIAVILFSLAVVLSLVVAFPMAIIEDLRSFFVRK